MYRLWKEYKKGLNKKLIERFSNVYEFCSYDMNKFMVLLRKGVYPYEYTDEWDKFNEKKLPCKESFYSNLTMEDISDTDYKHASNVFEKFNLNNLGDYHDLYVRSDTLLLADVFENSGMRVYIIMNYYYDMLLMIEDGIKGGICHAIQRYAKANNKYMKDYNKDKESSYIQYLDANNLYDMAMTEKLPVQRI